MTIIYIITVLLCILMLLLWLPLTITISYKEDFTLDLKYLFIKYRIYPKQAVQSKKKIKKTPKKKKKPKTSGKERLHIVWDLVQSAKKPVYYLSKRLKIRELEVSVMVGGEDAAKIAMDYAKINSSFYTLLATLYNFVDIQLKTVHIECDFLKEKTVYNCKANIVVRPIYHLVAFIRMVMYFIKDAFRKKQQEAELLQKGA